MDFVDIVIARACRAKAAYEEKSKISSDDILECAKLALLHRTREGGLREPPSLIEINKNFAKISEKYQA